MTSTIATLSDKQEVKGDADAFRDRARPLGVQVQTWSEIATAAGCQSCFETSVASAAAAKASSELHECHTFVIPRRYCKYRLAVLTRNPYARAKSLYAHAIHYDRERRDLATFIRDRLIGRRHSWCYWPVSVYVDLAKRFSGQSSVELVRLEFVLENLHRLGVAIDEFPHEHVLDDSTPDVKSEVADLVNLWARDDFTLGGYTTVGAIPRHSLPDPPVPNWSLHA